MIRLERIYHIFDSSGTVALKSVDFSLKEGELVLLLGKNGAGKTTLMHVLSAQLRPVHGIFYLYDQPVNFETYKAAIHQITSVIPQFPRSITPKWLTVQEYLSLSAQDSKEFQEKLSLLDQLGLTYLLHRPLSYLSEGELQRVIVVNQLTHSSSLLLGDEITSFLDSKNAELLTRTIKMYLEEKKKTLVLATHDYRLISYASRIYFMRDGFIEKVETVDESHSLSSVSELGRDLFVGTTRTLQVNSEGTLPLPRELLYKIRLPDSVPYTLSDQQLILTPSFHELHSRSLPSRSDSSVTTVSKRLILHRVQKSYARHLVLNIEHCEFNEGINVIYGPSGSGKTTLLRILAGLEDASQKEISYQRGETVVDSPSISYLPQNPFLPAHVLVEELFDALGVRQEIDHLVSQLGLKPLFSKYVNELSGGEKKKVALILAFLQHKDLYLLDEPTAFVDAASRNHIVEFLDTAFKDKLVLIATHDPFLGERFQQFTLQNASLILKS